MHEDITIVSGLPRSGTSMMMRMLKSGGALIVTDEIRQADPDNPKGYFELEKVKKIKEDHSWLTDMRGKVFKMVSMLLFDLPGAGYRYKIIFMERNLNEVLMSQRKMLERQNRPAGPEDTQMAALFEKHLVHVKGWLTQQPNMEVLFVNFNDVLANAKGQASNVNRFLGGRLDEAKMAAAVERSLYRNKVRT